MAVTQTKEDQFTAYKEAVLGVIRTCAILVNRLPDNDGIGAALATEGVTPSPGLTKRSITALSEERRIRVLIFAGNYRAIQLVEDGRPGACTLRPSGKPVKVLFGPRETSKQKPWKPGDPRPAKK